MRYMFINNAWAPLSTEQLAPNDGSETTILPLEDVPALTYQDEDSQPFLDEHGLTVIGEGYQNATPFDDPRNDDWQWDDDGAADDSAVAIEQASNSAPVADGARIDEDVYLDQVWDYDEPFVDLSESTTPVQAQAPPADQVGEDWFEWSELSPDAEQFDESAQVVADAVDAPRNEDWMDDVAVDDVDGDSSPVVPDVVVVAGIAPAEDWPWEDDIGQTIGNGGFQNVDPVDAPRDEDWTDDVPVEDWCDESAPVVADAAIVATALASEDWLDDAASDETDGDSAPVADSDLAGSDEWSEIAADDDFDGDSSPVVPDVVIAPSIFLDDAHDWSDPQVEEWPEDSGPVIADLVIPPAPVVDDAHDWNDPPTEEWLDESAPVVADVLDTQFEDASLLEAEFADEWLDDSAPVVADALTDAPVDESWIDDTSVDEFEADSAPVGANAVSLPAGIIEEQYDWIDDQPEEWTETSAPVGADLVAVYGWGARGKLGGVARDPWQRIGSEAATDPFSTIGSTTATAKTGKIGSEDA